MSALESGSKNWILRIRVGGERRDVGLGLLKVATLAEAREKALEYRRLIAQGVDFVPTFRDAAPPETARRVRERIGAVLDRIYVKRDGSVCLHTERSAFTGGFTLIHHAPNRHRDLHGHYSMVQPF